jgi:hypothetical protein
MHFFLLGIMVMVFGLSSDMAWCQEAAPAELSAEPVPAVGTLGIGTEGYGSPVRSDRIVSGEILGS